MFDDTSVPYSSIYLFSLRLSVLVYIYHDYILSVGIKGPYRKRMSRMGRCPTTSAANLERRAYPITFTIDQQARHRIYDLRWPHQPTDSVSSHPLVVPSSFLWYLSTATAPNHLRTAHTMIKRQSKVRMSEVTSQTLNLPDQMWSSHTQSSSAGVERQRGVPLSPTRQRGLHLTRRNAPSAPKIHPK